MAAYAGHRLLLAAPTLFGTSVIAFLLVHLIPGDLVTILLGLTAGHDQQTRAALIQSLHQHRTVPGQYVRWLVDVLRGNLGQSLVSGLSVRDELLRSYPVTLQLATMTMVIALLVGIPGGVLTVTRSGRALDAITRIVSLLFISAP